MRSLFSGIVPFVHVAEEGSFRAAAERLGVTSAAVSKAVRRLEEELGVQLFTRTTRHVRLTEEGEAFLVRCQEALELVRAGRDQLASAQEAVQGELTLSLSPVLGRLVMQHLPRLLARHPALRLHLRVTDQHSRLVEEGVDVALRIGPLADSSLIALKLHDTRWVTVASPLYLARRGLPHQPADLAAHACLQYRSPRGVVVPWSFLSPEGRPLLAPIDPAVVVDQGELLVEGALQGLGIAQVFSFLVSDALAEGRLVPVLEAWSAPGPPLHALYPAGQASIPRVRAALDLLAELFRGAAGPQAPPQGEAG